MGKDESIGGSDTAENFERGMTPQGFLSLPTFKHSVQKPCSKFVSLP
jgi:hypothetical protein